MSISCDIVTPFCLGYLPFLEECVTSIQNQTRKDWRLHLICDGSPEIAWEVARNYQSDNRIQVYSHQETVGSYVSIMRVFDRLNSGVMLVQDADDLALPHRIEATLTALKDRRLAAYSAGMWQFVDDACQNDEELLIKQRECPVFYPGIPILAEMHGRLVHGTLAIRKSAFEACNGYEDWFLGADSDFSERLQQRFPVKHSTDIVAKRRLHRGSLTQCIQWGKDSKLRLKIQQEIRQRKQNGYEKFLSTFGALSRIRKDAAETRLISTAQKTNFTCQYDKNVFKPIRVGFIYPNWTVGGTCSGVSSLKMNCPPGLSITGIAIRSWSLFDEAGQQRCRIPIWCPGTPPDNAKANDKIHLTKSFQEACQAVVDQSDVICLWGFSQPEPGLDEIEWQQKPVVVTSHGSCAYTREMLKNLTPYATHYAAVSQSAAVQWDLSLRDQVRVIYNGVDLKRLKPTLRREEIRKRWGIGQDEIVVAHVGRLGKDKNCLSVANAVKQLGSPYRALYVGSGYAEQQIRQQVYQLLGDRAIFTGAIEPVGDAFAALDCFLLASPSEGHCQALNEAWAAGVPVVATRVGAVPELEKQYGTLVVPISVQATPEELAAAVRQALSPENRSIINRARAVVHSRFTITQRSQDFLENMREIVLEHASEPAHFPIPKNRIEQKKNRSSLNGETVPKNESELPQIDCSIVITASRPHLFPEAFRHVRQVFPEAREIIVALSPEMPESARELVHSVPGGLCVPGTNNRQEAAAALYRAMSACTGKWIVHADDDDLWLQCDKKKINEAADDIAVITGAAHYYQFLEPGQISHKLLQGKTLADHRELAVPLNDQTAALPGSFRVTRRAAWQQVRPHVSEEFEYNEYILLVHLLAAGYRLEAANEPWGVVRHFGQRQYQADVPAWPVVYENTLQQIRLRAVSVQAKPRRNRINRLKRCNIQEWAVGITTAPRIKNTLEKSIQSLIRAGWSEFRIFAEPDSPLPILKSGMSLTQHQDTLGPFPNWYLSLTEMYLRAPQAEAYLICQDDILLSHQSREYLEQILWPAPEVGVVSLYCPSHEHRDQQTGFCSINPGWEAWGALAYLFSNPSLRRFLADETVLNHRHHGPAQGVKNIDSVVGGWCQREKLPYFIHTPSLVQHIGETSTIWPQGKVNGKRRAMAFDPDFFINAEKKSDHKP